MGCSRKYPYPPWRKLTILPLPFYGHPAQIQDILYMIPLFLCGQWKFPVGEAWFFFGTTQEYSPFYTTKFSLTNFICQMFFDRVN